MWLRELRIKNFRRISDLTVSFQKGLTILVGENNTGKTAIIDALRLMLFPGRHFDSLHLTENDFPVGTSLAPIEISCRFTDLTSDDEVHFLDSLVDVGDGKYEMQVNARVEFREATERCNVKMWGGETECGVLPSAHYDRFDTVYLKPLRDPERGLRPSQFSQVARLVNCLTPEDKRADFVEIAKKANDDLRKLESVANAKTQVDSQMEQIAGPELTQKVDLVFANPAFRRIIAGLQPEIEALPFSLNGLGYNNLVYTAATLGTLSQPKDLSHRAILVEEPEAHLHPQLQVLLLRHCADVACAGTEATPQIIATSHSPILASQAPIDSIVAIHETNRDVMALSMANVEFERKTKKKLERYLDATRAELFFARKILMVEGISEALLMPVLAKTAGGCLKQSAVTVLNVEGINFDAFLPLFRNPAWRVPMALLTDGDASSIGEQPSDTATKLKALNGHSTIISVGMSEITFEHELARQPQLLPHLLSALTKLHPIIGQELATELKTILSADDRAAQFLKVIKEKKVRKGELAQELALIIEEAQLPQSAVPLYIQRAFKHLGVIKEVSANGESDSPPREDSVGESDTRTAGGNLHIEL